MRAVCLCLWARGELGGGGLDFYHLKTLIKGKQGTETRVAQKKKLENLQRTSLQVGWCRGTDISGPDSAPLTVFLGGGVPQNDSHDVKSQDDEKPWKNKDWAGTALSLLKNEKMCHFRSTI